jgi:hypothetical protein
VTDTVLQSLKDSSASIRKQATAQLSPGPLLTAVGGLLTALDSAINLIGDASATYATRLQYRQVSTAGTISEAVKIADRRAIGLSATDRAENQKAVQAELQRKASLEIAAKIATNYSRRADTVTANVVERAAVVEDEVARLQLMKLEPLSMNDRGRSLESLLAASNLEADLGAMPVEALTALFHAEMRLDSAKFAEILPLVARIAKQRSTEEWVIQQTRNKRRTPRAMQYSTEATAYRKLLIEIEGILDARTSPDLVAFETVIRPQLGSLIRATTGVDPRALSQPQYEAYVREFKFGRKLGETPPLDGWPLRYVVLPVDPRVRAAMPAVNLQKYPKQATK